jgi:acetolactate synthase-1/2/3 large subunit
MWSDPTTPFLLEIAIEQGTNVYPKLAFGKPFGSMEPDCSPLEMEGT